MGVLRAGGGFPARFSVVSAFHWFARIREHFPFNSDRTSFPFLAQVSSMSIYLFLTRRRLTVRQVRYISQIS